MAIQVSGKHFNLGEAMRTHILERVDSAVGKYFDGGVSGHIVVDHEGSGYRSDCTLHLSSGVTLHSEGRAQEPYPSFDQAAERLEKRLRRYKRKLKEHHIDHNHRAVERGDAFTNYVLELPDPEVEVVSEINPVIIAEQLSALRTVTVASAVMEIDLTGAPVVVFRNSGSGRINIIYKRNDGNIGWIDPVAKVDEKTASNG